MKKKYFTACLVVAATLFITVVSAQASTITFESISGDTDVSSQLSADVQDLGGGVVGFTFYNEGDIQSIIGSVFFDDENGLLEGPLAFGTFPTGVDFKDNGTANFPQGNNLTPSFETDFSATKNGSANNGVNNTTDNSEYLTIIFDLADNKTFGDIINALSNGDLRIGLHIQSFADGSSDSYGNNPVPIPAAAWLLGSGLLGLVGVRRRVRKKHS